MNHEHHVCLYYQFLSLKYTEQQKLSKLYRRHCTMSFTLIKLSFLLQLFSILLMYPVSCDINLCRRVPVLKVDLSPRLLSAFLFILGCMFLQHANMIIILTEYVAYVYMKHTSLWCFRPNLFKPQGLLKH